MAQELEQAISANYGRLTAGQRRAIDRLLADTRYAAVISAPELAQEVGVSESTVTRAAQALGFAGYPDLQAQLRARFFNHSGAVAERVEAGIAELGATPEEAAIRVMLEDAESVRATAEDLSPETVRAAVETLVAARRVFVFGARGSHGLAIMLGIGLRLLLDARILNPAAGDLPDQLLDLSKNDVLVAITFRRVDRTTVTVLRHAADVGAQTIVLTDHLSSPAARLGGLTLIARLGTLRLTPSYAAGASLVNALLTAVWLRNHDNVAPRLREAERLLQEFDAYAEA
ncbi:MAG: MurR/RpiR family transcriptional regulator [Thermomicrobiales bacterium]